MSRGVATNPVPIDWIFITEGPLLTVTAQRRGAPLVLTSPQSTDKPILAKDLYRYLEELVMKTVNPWDSITLPDGRRYVVFEPKIKFMA